MKKFVLGCLKIYQRYISVFSFGSCRFYPTCSEYAKWQFSHNNFFLAILLSIYRILRCNPYNKGGIDYPSLKIRLNKQWAFKKQKVKLIKFWFVPNNKNAFYIIKTVFKPLN